MDVMTKADLRKLVDELPEEALNGAAIFLGRLLRGEVGAHQAWVWTVDWQEQFRFSTCRFAAGRAHRLGTGEE
jgi:hypothetical protein